MQIVSDVGIVAVVYGFVVCVACVDVYANITVFYVDVVVDIICITVVGVSVSVFGVLHIGCCACVDIAVIFLRCCLRYLCLCCCCCCLC